MKRFFFSFCYWSGLTSLWAWRTRKQVKILCYHSITRLAHDTAQDPHKLHLPLALFRQHLTYLQHHYQVIALRDYLAAQREGRSLPPNAVILTFDDGFRNFRTLAAPVLAELGLPATVFIITGKTAEKTNPSRNGVWQAEDDFEHLTWEDVRHLQHAGRVEVGSHTHTHPRLTRLSLDEAARELQTAHTVITARLPVSDPSLSYPHGLTSPDISRHAAAAGYGCAVSSALGGNDEKADNYNLRRIVIAADDDLPTFAARVAGLTWHRNVQEAQKSQKSKVKRLKVKDQQPAA